jgi:hypothetical protein
LIEAPQRWAAGEPGEGIMRGDDDSAQAGAAVRVPSRDERPTVFFEDLPPVGQSLVRAFESGIAWTPDFHRAFVKGGPLDRFLSHSAAWGASTADGDADRSFSSSPPVGGPTYTDIDGEVLYEIISHTIIERQDRTQTGIEIGDPQGKRAKEWIDDKIRGHQIDFDRRGIRAEWLHVKDNDQDGIALNCLGILQPIPIQLIDCEFHGRVVFDMARLGPLSLEGATIEAKKVGERPDLSLEGTVLEGPLNLSGIKKCAGVSLNQALIGGLFNAQGAKLSEFHDREKDEKFALSADGVVIGGSAFLSEGFDATGEVRFVGATVVGDFDSHEGSFTNLGKEPQYRIALNCNGIVVMRNVLMRPNCTSRGEVNFVGGKIKGNFECDDSYFVNASQDYWSVALNCNSISVERDVFLRHGFYATGEIDLVGATIGGQLDCEGGSFFNHIGNALNLYSLKVKDQLKIVNLIDLSGRIVLRQASVGTLQVDESSWPRHGDLHLQGLEYHAVDGPTFGSIGGCQPALEWLSRQPADARWLALESQPWTQLAGVLSAAGRTRDARDVLIDMNWRRTLGSVAMLVYHLIRGVAAGSNVIGLLFRAPFFWVRDLFPKAANPRRDKETSGKAAPEEGAAYADEIQFRDLWWPLRVAVLSPVLGLAAGLVVASIWIGASAVAIITAAFGVFLFLGFIVDGLFGLRFREQRAVTNWNEYKKYRLIKRRKNALGLLTFALLLTASLIWAMPDGVLESRGASHIALSIVVVLIFYFGAALWLGLTEFRGWLMRLLSLMVAVPTNLMLGLLIGWGFRPVLAAVWGFLLILTGWFVFHTAEVAQFMRPNLSDAYDVCDGDPADYESFSALGYSFDTLIPFFDLGQESRWRPVDERVVCIRDENGIIIGRKKVKFPRPTLSTLKNSDLLPPAFRPWLAAAAPDFADDYVAPKLATRLENWFEDGWARKYLWFHIAFGYILATMAAAAITGIVKLKE